MASRITEIAISWFYRVLAIIILVFVANIIAYFSSIEVVDNLVSFLNSNLVLLLFISLLFFLGSIFYVMLFPVSLLTPIFEALGSVFLVAFLIRFVSLLDEYIGSGIGNFLQAYDVLIYIIVFAIVVILGFVYVIQRHEKRRKWEEDDEDLDGEEIEEEITEESSPRGARTRRVVKRKVKKR